MILFKKENGNKFYSYNAFDPHQKLLGTIAGTNIVVPLLSALLNQNKEYVVDNVDYEIMKEAYKKCLQRDKRFSTIIKEDITTLALIVNQEPRKEKRIKLLDLIEYLRLLVAE